MGPLIQTFYQSFFDMRTQTMALGYHFVGLANYINLFQDKYFLDTLGWTLEFTFYSVIFEVSFALFLALLMKKEMRGQGLIRLTILLPWSIPVIVAGIVFTKIFAHNGIINTLFVAADVVNDPVNFFGIVLNTKIVVIIAEVWKSTPYLSLLILAGLLMIPNEQYEASYIDGANKVQSFFNITIPCLIPTLSVTMLFRIIGVLRAYGLMVAMTGGGPAGSTGTAAMYAVDSFFRYGKISYGSAVSVVMLFVSGLISLFFINGLQGKVK